jgi:hypothetical protein
MTSFRDRKRKAIKQGGLWVVVLVLIFLFSFIIVVFGR